MRSGDNTATTAPTGTLLVHIRGVKGSWRARGAALAWTAGLLFLSGVSVRHKERTRAKAGRTHLVVLPDFADEVRERLVDVDALLRGRLDELAAKVLREVAALWCDASASVSCENPCTRIIKTPTVHAHLAFVLEITLVRNNDDRELIHVLHTQDLLVEGADFLERVS